MVDVEVDGVWHGMTCKKVDHGERMRMYDKTRYI